MADISITVASVLNVDGTVQTGTAGATITAGQPLYLDTADNLYKTAENNGGNTAAGLLKSTAAGISLHAALAGQPIAFVGAGTMAIGATIVVGETYVVSANAGRICPLSDIGAGNWVTHLGVARAAGQITVRINVAGVRHA